MNLIKKFTKKQECIPVACVPSVAVAVSPRGLCLTACWDTSLPQEQTPRTRHPPDQPTLGADTPQEQTPPDQAPPLETCCKACWDTTPCPPPGQTHTCKGITFTTSLRTVMSCKKGMGRFEFLRTPNPLGCST